MREDMFKVIVERPRKGGGATPRHERRPDADTEGPAREPLKARFGRNTKWLNENLAPLRRWLERQVDRPWDKVFSELSARIDRRNTVQAHVLQHLEDFVAIRVIDLGGVLHVVRHGEPVPLVGKWSGWKLFVDPRTGILRRNRDHDRIRRELRERHKHRWDPVCPHPRRIVSATVQLHRIDGVWYAVELEPIPPAPPKGSHWRDPPLDVLRHRNAWQCPAWEGERGAASNRDLFGDRAVYAAAKRQLDRNELRRHGLTNDNG
jgi:hypothetical protein